MNIQNDTTGFLFNNMQHPVSVSISVCCVGTWPHPSFWIKIGRQSTKIIFTKIWFVDPVWQLSWALV